ncbi:MAG: isocitrate/isopropylmalate family dehydrogenase [Balneolaceae bacterium]|nr:isocitrate/isopropylmalate family dehydrogenase [Balneolaceae bacterium]MDR9446530.1 isocitrate/isopropylmalate family dehydrogenase [Balneolaceae bacterium]
MPHVVLIPGDGIGPEITQSIKQIFETADADIQWVECAAGEGAVETHGSPLPDETLEAVERHRVALKGPLTTPLGAGFRSINVALRQHFELFANIRPARTLPGIDTPFRHVDMVLFRENTQGLYIGRETWVEEGQEAESLAVVSRKASERIIKAAFDHAVQHERKKVSLIHKANILKFTTGLFLDVGKEIAKEYPSIEFEDLIVDNMAMQMVMRPERFDVVVTTNMFGDILSDLASGLVGGLGVTGAGNLGENAAIFEAVHGSAPDIAGKGLANPLAFLFSAVMMLEHLEQSKTAERIRAAIYTVLQEHKDDCTTDIGGLGNTQRFTEAICNVLSP